MKCPLGACFLLIFLIIAAFGSIQVAEALSIGSDRVNWQIHSWDDLREWPAMMAKGAQWLKIDMHFKDGDFCESQGISDPDGCFVLLHDTPSSEVRYNTSVDVINYIQAHPKQFNNPSFVVYIALCFKSTPLDICGAAGAPFLRLLNKFKTQTDALVRSGANLEFVIDGSLIMTFECTMKAFQPWVSTWQGLPVEAFFTNNATLGYDRLLVYDLPAVFSAIYATEQLNWGKFAAGPWPLLVWEPSDEAELVTFTQVYLDWAAKNPNFVNPLPDYRFAINIDPVQFQVYTGSTTKRAWRNLLSIAGTHPKIAAIPPQTNVLTNKQYFSERSTALKGGAHVESKDLQILTQPSSGLAPLTFLSFQYENGELVYSVMAAEELQGNITTLKSTSLVPSARSLGYISAASITLFPPQTPGLGNSKFSTPVVALSSMDQGTVNFYLLGSNQLKPLLVWAPADGADIAVTSWITSTNSSRLPILARLAANGGNTQPSLWSSLSRFTSKSTQACGWYLQFWEIRNLNQPTPTRRNSLCVSGLPSFSSSSLAQPSLSVAGYMDMDGNGEGMLTVAYNGVVQAAYFSFTNSSNGVSLASVTSASVIGVGSNSSVSITWDQETQTPYAHEVHTDGFCWNTETRNKQAATTVCEQIPVLTPSVLNYNYAPLSHWSDYLTSYKPQPLTACHESILHGTYDQGRNPSLSLTSIGSKIGLLEVHEGWRTGDHDISECGAPVVLSANGGVVLDSWPLPEPLWD